MCMPNKVAVSHSQELQQSARKQPPILGRSIAILHGGPSVLMLFMSAETEPKLRDTFDLCRTMIRHTTFAHTRHPHHLCTHMAHLFSDDLQSRTITNTKKCRFYGKHADRKHEQIILGAQNNETGLMSWTPERLTLTEDGVRACVRAITSKCRHARSVV